MLFYKWNAFFYDFQIVEQNPELRAVMQNPQ